MSRPRTLAQLRARVRIAADTGPDGTDRHPDAEVTAMINDSWQAMRELASDNGHQMYLKPAVATMAVGAAAPYSFGIVTLPEDCVRLFGIDVTVTTNDVRSLFATSFSERNQFRDAYGTANGIPVAFFLFSIGVELNTTVTPGSIGILPAPDRAYSYTIWYLPRWSDVIVDDYIFDGVAGWEDWVVWDCVIKLAAGDNDMAQTAQIATQERAEAAKRLSKAANSAQRVGPAQKIDMAGRYRQNRAWSQWRRT